MDSESFLIKQIENAIRGIKLGTKKPSDVSERCNRHLERLKKVNIGMYEELLAKFAKQCQAYQNKHEKTY